MHWYWTNISGDIRIRKTHIHNIKCIKKEWGKKRLFHTHKSMNNDSRKKKIEANIYIYSLICSCTTFFFLLSRSHFRPKQILYYYIFWHHFYFFICFVVQLLLWILCCCRFLHLYLFRFSFFFLLIWLYTCDSSKSFSSDIHAQCTLISLLLMVILFFLTNGIPTKIIDVNMSIEIVK